MRGSGKTTVARLLSRQLCCKMLDTDKEIEKQEKMPVGKIIEKSGIELFRKKETVLLKKIRAKNTIIAAGGGIILKPENRKLLKKIGTIIYLFARPEILAKRIKDAKTRPILTSAATMKNDLKNLFKNRRQIYKNLASHIINTEKLNPKEITQKIINLQTQKFCIFGHPINHSLSPIIYNSAFKELGLNAVCKAIDAPDIGKAIKKFRQENFAGASITTPHKVEVMKHLDRIDPTAKKIGAVNTIKNQNNVLIGYNTDSFGAIKSLKEAVNNLKSKKVVLLGAGGAAKAIAFGLMKEKINFVILNVDLNQARLLAEKFHAHGSGTLEDFKKHANADIIINATSVGMEGRFENQSPIDANLIRSDHIVFDIVYKPKNTVLLKEAAKKRAHIIYGYKMLLHQAELQFKILTGSALPVKKIEKFILKKLY